MQSIGGSVRRVVAVLFAAVLALSLPGQASAFHTDIGSEWYLQHDHSSGADWVRFWWPTPPYEGYDHVRVTLAPHHQCRGTQPYSSSYEGRAKSVTFTGVAPDGMYELQGTVFDTNGNVIDQWADAVRTPPSSVVTIDPIEGPLVAGTPVTVTGRILEWDCMFQEFSPRTRLLELHGRTAGGEWQVLDSAKGRGWMDTRTETEDVLGRVWFEQRPTADTEYRLFYAGAWNEQQPVFSETATVALDASGEPTLQPTSLAFTKLPGRSPARTARVRPRVTAALSKSTLVLGRTVTVTGRVRPRHVGKRVLLQRHDGEQWVNIRSKRLDSDSRYRMRWEANARGVKRLRVFRPADWNHASGRSRRLELTVRRP